MIADRLGDETGGNRRAVVMVDRNQPHRVDAAFVDDQRAQLRVAVLLDHEREIVTGDEAANGRMEREGADAHTVDAMPARLDHGDRLVHCRRGRTEIDHAVFGRLGGVGLQRSRHQVLGGVELTD